MRIELSAMVVKCNVHPTFIVLILILLMSMSAVVTKTITRHFSYAASGFDITSPNFPLSYGFDGNVHEYVIETKLLSRSFISLTFSDFHLDVALSTLKIYDGKVKDNPPTSSWTGTRPPMYLSSGKTLTLIFKPGTKQTPLHRSVSVGFKVRVRFHGDQRSRSSPLIGQAEIPRLVPLNGFCGHMHTTSPTVSHLATSGHQVSPQLSEVIGENSFNINCFWSISVLSQLFYLSIKSSSRTKSLYSVHDGQTSEDVVISQPYKENDLTTDGIVISTYELTRGSFYVKFSGLLKITDFFAFSFATTFTVSVSLAEGLRTPNRTRVCPFKSCDREGGRCVWDWSVCLHLRSGVDDSPDCDEYGRNEDIKSCFPADMTYSAKYKLPKRCYRKSVDACDDFYDCPQYKQDEMEHCPARGVTVPRAVKIWVPMGVLLSIALSCFLAWIGCCSGFCDCVSAVCDVCRGCCQCICEETCIIRCRQRLRRGGSSLLSRIRGFTDCWDSCRSPADGAPVEQPAVAEGLMAQETLPPSYDQVATSSGSEGNQTPASCAEALGRCGRNIRSRLRDRCQVCSSSPEGASVDVNDTDPEVGPPGGVMSDTELPSYDQVAPTPSNENLPSYSEAIVRPTVVSDGTRPPPSYESVW